MNKAITFLQSYCKFNPSWAWILTGISRNKDNPNPTHDFLRRLVVTKYDDIDYCYQELHTLGNKSGTIYRIYVSLNARDLNKTFFRFQQKLLEINLGLFEGHEDAKNQVGKVGSLWKTELAQTHNRATKYFLLDVDDDPNAETSAAIVKWIADNKLTEIVAVRGTVSGTHIVIQSCDTRGLTAFCKTQGYKVDIQKDSMVFVEQYAGAL